MGQLNSAWNRGHVFVALLFVASCAPSAPDIGTSTRAVVSAPVETIVAYAENSMRIEGSARVLGGHVAVAETSGAPYPTSGTLADGARLSVGSFVTIGGDATAATTVFEYGSALVDANDFDRVATVEGSLVDGLVRGGVSFPMIPPPPLPTVPPVLPGTGTLHVLPGEEMALSATVSVGSIHVGTGATLWLRGGLHEVQEISTSSAASIVALGGVDVRLAHRMRLGAYSVFTATTGLAARDVRVEVLGTNVPDAVGAPIAAVDFGDETEGRMIVTAPYGTVRVGDAATIDGAIFARDILVGFAAQVRFESGRNPYYGQAPTAYDDAVEVTEDFVRVLTAPGIMDNDLDPNGDVIEAHLITGPAHGTATVALDGAVTYTPDANFNGTDSLTYAVTDGTHWSTTATVTFSVSAIQDAPRIVSEPSRRTFVGAGWRYPVVVEDSDPGDSHTYSLEPGAPAGMGIDAAGTVTWTPLAGEVGTQVFAVRVVDGAGLTDVQTRALLVTATPEADRMVIYATDSVLLSGGSIVKGDVGVETLGWGPPMLGSGWWGAARGVLASSAYLDGDLLADSVGLEIGSSVHDVYANAVIHDGSASSTGQTILPTMPSLPSTSTVTGLSGILDVPVSTTQTLGGGSTYAQIIVRESACVELAAGTHAVHRLTVEPHGCVVALGPVTIQVNDWVALGDDAYIGVAYGANLSANDIRIEVHGDQGGATDPWAQPAAFTTGARAMVRARVLAPNGTIRLGNDSASWGLFHARNVFADVESTTSYDGPDDEPYASAPIILSSAPTTVDERETYEYTVHAVDYDLGDQVRYRLIEPPPGMDIDDNTGEIVWDTNLVAPGEFWLQVRAEDLAGNFDSEVVPITVVDINDPPVVAASVVPDFTVGHPHSNWSIPATDPDVDDQLVYALSSEPSWLTVDPITGVVHGDPPASAVGAHTFVARATDEGGLFDERTFDVTVVPNQPPVFQSVPVVSAVEDSPYAYQARALDPEGDMLTFSGSPAVIDVTEDGLVTWAPTQADVGTLDVVIAVTDGIDTREQPFTIQVLNANDPPSIDAIPNGQATEDQLFSVTLTATDPDPNETLTFSVGGVTGASLTPIDATSAQLTWTPGDGVAPVVTLSVTVTDVAGASDATTFEVTVTSVNDPPTITETTPAPATENVAWMFGVVADDPDGDPLTYSIAGLQNISATGNVTWTPGDDDTGSHTFVVTVSDGALTASRSFDVEVQGVNDPPTLAPILDRSAAQTQAIQVAALGQDVDGDELFYSLDLFPPGMVIDSALGLIDWVPSSVQSGPYDVLVRVTDEAGASAFTGFTVDVQDINLPPVFVSTHRTTAEENTAYTYDIIATDPDLDAVRYALMTRPIGMSIGATSGRITWVPSTAQAGTGIHAVTVRALDDHGLYVDTSFDITVAPAGANCTAGNGDPRCGAVAWSYGVRADSVPLGAVVVDETGPGGPRTFTTDLSTGLVMLGGAQAGSYAWTFTAQGFAPAHRTATLNAESVAWVPVPRLLPLTDLTGQVLTSGSTFLDVDGRVELSFGSGAVASAGTLEAGVLDGQSLPGYLPRGWSFAGGVWYELSSTVQQGPTAIFTLPQALPAGESTLLLAEWDVVTSSWIAVQNVTVANPTSAAPTATVQLGLPGGYALLLVDDTPSAPALPSAGVPVPQDTSILPPFDELVVTAIVTPESQIASTDPEQVTAVAHVGVSHASAFPSSVVVPGRLYERYAMRDRGEVEVPILDLPIALYRYPAVAAGQRSAAFPVRPRYLFDSTEATDIHQHVTIVDALDFEGAPIGTAGGAVARDGMTLTAASGVLPGAALVTLRSVDLDALSTGGLDAERAFRMEWSGGILAGGRFDFSTGVVTPNRDYVLARHEVSHGHAGWVPVERFASDAAGQLTSVEPMGALPGVTRGGTYALFDFDGPQALVSGTIEDGAGSPRADVVVSLAGSPWSARTDASGAFALLQPVGAFDVVAEALASSETGFATGTVDANGVTGLVVVVGAQAPRVVEIIPTDGATNVAVVTGVEVRFSEPMDPESVSQQAIVVTDGLAQAVPGHHTLRPDGRTLTFYSAQPLAYASTFTVDLDANLADLSGTLLQGTTGFTFDTESAPAPATNGPRLTSYEPGSSGTPCEPYDATQVPPGFDPTNVDVGVPGFDPTDDGVTCIVGGLGVADPSVPVILSNDDTGSTVAVLSRSNGSFKGYLRAAPEDLLSATFVNANGTQVEVRLERQLYADGRVALYASGGVIEVDNPFGGAPVELVVEPGAIARRGVFDANATTAADALAQAGGVAPVGGTVLMGLAVDYVGDPLSASLDIRLPVAEADLGLPAGNTVANHGFQIMRPVTVDIDGVPTLVYDMVDNLDYENGGLASHSFPFAGILAFAFQNGLRGFTEFLSIVMLEDVPIFLTGFAVACEEDDVECRYAMPRSRSDGTSVHDGARPVVGAVVGVTRDTVGQTISGDMVSISGAGGRFAVQYPRNISAYALRGRSSQHPGQDVRNQIPSFLETGAHRNLVFVDTDRDALGLGFPNVAVTHAPLFPLVYDTQPAPPTADQQATVAIRATHPDQQTSIVSANVLTAVDAAGADVRSQVTSSQLGSTTSIAPNGQSATYQVRSVVPATVEFEVVALLADGASLTVVQTIFIGATPPATTESPVPSDTNDDRGPVVVRSTPAQGARAVSTAEPLTLVFDEPVHPDVVNRPQSFRLVDEQGFPVGLPSVVRRGFGETVDLRFDGLRPEKTYRLMVAQEVTDLHGNPHNQRPDDPNIASYSLVFSTAARLVSTGSGVLPGVTQGGGAVVHGGHAFVIDRSVVSATANVLRIFDISDPRTTPEVSQLLLPTRAMRDMLVIDGFDYLRPTGSGNSPCGAAPMFWEVPAPATVGGLPACLSTNRTLLVMIGGWMSVTGQRLVVADVTDVQNPYIIATDQVGSPVSTASNLKWRPPYIGFLSWEVTSPLAFSGFDEFGVPLEQDRGRSVTTISAINLLTFIFGDWMTSTQFAQMPDPTPVPVDANQDGDFVDPIDVFPLPPRQPFDVVGRVGEYRITHSLQQILDYDLGADGFVGAVLGSGSALDSNGFTTGGVVPPQLMTRSASDLFTVGFEDFVDSRLFAMKYLPGFTLRQRLGPDRTRIHAGTDLPGDYVIVAVRPQGSPDTVLRIVDVSDLTQPVVVDSGQPGVSIPGTDLGATVQKLELDPLTGNLVVVTSHDRIWVDLGRLTMAPGPNRRHPAILAVEADVGTSAGADGASDFGVYVDPGLRRVTFTGPRIEFIDFPSLSAPLDTQGFLAGAPVGAASTAYFDGLFAAAEVTPTLALARIEAGATVVATEDDADVHHYVMIRAPGSVGPTIELSLEALDPSGRPVPNTPRGMAPVRAGRPESIVQAELQAFPSAAPIPTFTAHRLTSDKNSRYYNVFVSQPFIVVGEEVQPADLAGATGLENGGSRVVLHSRHSVRVALDPTVTGGGLLEAYRSNASPGILRPGTNAVLEALELPRVVGHNPPPLVAQVRIPRTPVLAHSGELRFSATDHAAPGTRMSIVLQRTYTGQDQFSGSFGAKFVHNFEQSLTLVSAAAAADGIPGPQKSDTGQEEPCPAESVRFNDGYGNVLCYGALDGSSGAPTEYASDPLMSERGWLVPGVVTDWYEPPPGVFTALVRFSTGEFSRLTPGGMEYRYTKDGRFKWVADRYPHYRHELTYDEGLLRSVDDRSVNNRGLRFFYYLANGVPGRRAGDLEPPVAAAAGRIAQVCDTHDRCVDYAYSAEGQLERVEDIEITTVRASGVPGRRTIHYVYKPGGGGILSITDASGANGQLTTQPQFADTSNSQDEIVSSTNGVRAGTQYDAPPVARSEDMSNYSRTVALPEGAQAGVTFNADGQPTSFTIGTPSEPNEPPGGIPHIGYDANSRQVRTMTFPEGSVIETTYDSASPNLRSRGNVLRVVRRPGPRGGPVLEQVNVYDARYNQPSGVQTLLSDQTVERSVDITLTNDGREVARTTYDGTYSMTRVWDDVEGRIDSEEGIDGVTRAFTYDATSDFVETVTDGEGVTVTYAYDCGAGARGHYCRRTLPAGPAETRTFDEHDRVIQVDNGQQRTTIGRDLAGRPTHTIQTVDVGENYEERRRFDVDGFMVERTQTNLEVNGTVSPLVWAYAADDAGRVSEVVAQDGVRLLLDHDYAGRLRTKTYGEAHSEEYRYDGHGNRVQILVGDSDATRQLWQQAVYDGHDRLVTVRDPNGGEQNVQYDGNGQPVMLSVTDASYGMLRHEVRANVDAFGRPGSVTVGGETTTFAYHPNAGPLQTTTTSPRGAVRRTTYDFAGRTLIDSLTATPDTVFAVSHTYDLVGRPDVITATEGTEARAFFQDYAYAEVVPGGFVSSVTDGLGTVVAYDPRYDGRPRTTTAGGLLTTTHAWSVTGESLGEQRPSGFIIDRELDAHRRESGVGVPTSLRTLAYDDGHRLESVTMRDGSQTLFSNFHPVHQKPTQVVMPEGTIASTYNNRGDLLTRTVTTNGGGYAETESFAHDTLGRVREANVTSGAELSFDYDGLGVNTRQTLVSNQGSFERRIEPNADGSVARMTYPRTSGVVTHDRDLAGRLLGLTVAGTGQGASLYDVGTFATAERAGTVTLGNAVERLDVYDDRRRLTERSYRRSDGSLVASFRYAYDAANRELGRLDAHRGGRANLYSYAAERLATAELGARALVSGSGFGVADVQFTYTYESSGEDRLTSVGTQVPVGETAPAVAQSYAVYDSMGHASEIDGVTRARDAHGNVESTQSVHGVLQLDYDVRNRLRRVDRPDGSTVQYTYRADDVLLERQVTCAATVVEPCRDSHRLYVYDGLLLLQEYEAGSPPSLRAQYYYADEGDVPFAADLWHDVNQRLERYYYIVDRMGSITGLMDASGAVVERIDYTVWGEPEITTQDTLSPSIASVRGDGTGDLLVTFTEPVDPALVSVAETGLGVTVTDLTSELTVTANLGGALSVTSVAVEPDATVAYGTTYRVTVPGLSVGATYVVALAADAVQDPWGNRNTAESVSLAYADAAAVAAGPGSGVVTAPVVVERSAVGNTLGFQAHLHDWDVDLVLMRARVFEPRTGMFLQRDPNGYEDSVNLYAGMRWDPVNLRDPTGEATTPGELEDAYAACVEAGVDEAKCAQLSDRRSVTENVVPGGAPSSHRTIGNAPVSGRQATPAEAAGPDLRFQMRVAGGNLGLVERPLRTPEGDVIPKTEREKLLEHSARLEGFGEGLGNTMLALDAPLLAARGTNAAIGRIQRFGTELGEAGMRAASRDMRVLAGGSQGNGMYGVEFEGFVSSVNGGTGSFTHMGREFDGAFGDVWFEAKSGPYWERLSNPKRLQKFKSDMGARKRIANDAGKQYELHSNTPIPDAVKTWLRRAKIRYVEYR